MSKKIATLWDNKDSDDHDRDTHSSDGREAQAFYAGGSEHSGQQILGPNRDPNSLIENLFNHARHAASQPSDSNDPSSRSSGSGSGSGTSSTLPIIFWRDGFTVGEEGELREYASEDNRRFLECLKRGETPPELASRVRGGMIDVKLENKAHQDYKPVERLQAFTGEGHRLGAPSPATLDEQPTQSAEQTNTSNRVESSLELNESQPQTTIQVRLVDNSRLVIRANLTHTVEELVSHIRSTRPQYSSTNFVLATTFPARELSDLKQTISEAKLVSASVLQKIKR